MSVHKELPCSFSWGGAGHSMDYYNAFKQLPISGHSDYFQSFALQIMLQ